MHDKRTGHLGSIGRVNLVQLTDLPPARPRGEAVEVAVWWSE